MARAHEVYTDLHWGNEPDAELVFDDPRYDGEELAELGELTSVTYRTRKGTQEQIDFFHDFEEPLPRLCVDEDRHLVIIGGGYNVTTKGIEG